MDDRLLVRSGKTVRDLNAVIDRLAHRQWPATEALAQRLPFQQLGHDEKNAAGGVPDVVDGQDVRVIQCGRGARFLFETAATIGIRGERRRQDLDGNFAPEPRIARAIHLAHSTRANG